MALKELNHIVSTVPSLSNAHILILDDHVIIRRGLRNLISSRLPQVRVEDLATLEALTGRLNKPPMPDLMVLDLQLADGNAMDELGDLRRNHPAVKILIYSMSPERIYAQRVLNLGCAGYVNKDSSEDEVIRAIERVLAGEIYLGLETAQRMQHQEKDTETGVGTDPFVRLSDQELRVLNELLDGHGVKEIASRMMLGVSTVATYKARLLEKLGIENLLQLQTLAQAHRYRG